MHVHTSISLKYCLPSQIFACNEAQDGFDSISRSWCPLVSGQSLPFACGLMLELCLPWWLPWHFRFRRRRSLASHLVFAFDVLVLALVVVVVVVVVLAVAFDQVTILLGHHTAFLFI